MIKLLVPVDFSESSDNACQYALRLAAETGAEINLVHYYNDLLIDQDMPPTDEFDISQQISDNILRAPANQAKASLEELCRNLSEQLNREKITGVALSHIFIWGNAEDGIIETCENDGYSLIIMGSNGEGRKLFAGSLTMKVIKRSSVPVMAIPPEIQFKNIRHALYATDFEAADYQAIENLFQLFPIFNMVVSCVHVSEKDTPSEEIVKMENLKEVLSSRYPQRIKFQVIRNADIVDGLREYMQKEETDMIALTRHNPTLLEKILGQSTTREMLSRTHIPLLAFHT